MCLWLRLSEVAHRTVLLGSCDFRNLPRPSGTPPNHPTPEPTKNSLFAGWASYLDKSKEATEHEKCHFFSDEAEARPITTTTLACSAARDTRQETHRDMFFSRYFFEVTRGINSCEVLDCPVRFVKSIAGRWTLEQSIPI